jgi:hypothetical protein
VGCAIRLPLILYLASTALSAQTLVRDAFVPVEADCPVGVRATLEKGANLLPAQRLQVILSQWPPVGIVASRITVHGVAPVADGSQPPEITKILGLIPVVDHSRPSHTSNVPRASTEPKGAPTGQGQLAALDDILSPPQEPVILRVSSPDSRWYAWVSGINAIKFIELESVSYADGTSWQVSNGKTCRVSVGSSVW